VADPTRYRNPDADPRGAWLASDLTVAGTRSAMMYDLAGSLPPEGRSWRYRRERMNQLLAEGRILVREGRRPVLKRYLADSAGETHHRARLPNVVGIIHEFSTGLARRLALHPGELADLEWRDLERALAAAFEGIGFDTRLTRPAKDGGFDIELAAGEDSFLVEVKHWSLPSRVGTAQITEFAEVVVRGSASRGLLLSSSGFTTGVIAARLEVSPTRVALGDGRKIIGLFQRYLQHEHGIWWPESELPELLFVDTH
jgi:hypothetical protein